MKKRLLEGVKAGDKLYHIIYGEVIVTRVDYSIYAIQYTTSGYNSRSCTPDGFDKTSDANPSVYWSKPEIVIPKRKIKIEEKVFVYLGATGNNILLWKKPNHTPEDGHIVDALLTYEIEEK